MPHALGFLLFVLSSTNYAFCSLQFTRPGENVTLQCQCYNNRSFWFRINSNESVQVISTKWEQSPYISKRLNNTHVALMIVQVARGDSGRYYCGERLSNDLHFSDNGTVVVGDAWTHSSTIHLLMEQMGESGKQELDWTRSNRTQELMSEWMYENDENSKSDLSDFPDVEHSELRCVVTGLSAPWVNIIWRSSHESWLKAGQTWSLTDTEGGYTVESRLRIGLKVTPDWECEDEEYYYEHSHHLCKKMNLDMMVELDEELWCDVHVGVNLSVQSPKFSFLPQTEWCNQVLYGEIALCVLCLCFLTWLICDCLHYQHKGSEVSATEASQTSNSCGDVPRDITYVQLDIKEQPGTERQQRQKNRQEHSLVYSEVRCKHE